MYVRDIRPAALGALALLTACSGGRDPAAPSFIGLGITSAHSVVAGNTLTGRVDLVRRNFGGDVQLVAEGAPSGVSVSFAPAKLSDTISVSTISFVTTSTAADGTVSIVVRASGIGVPDATIPFALTVRAVASVQDRRTQRAVTDR